MSAPLTRNQVIEKIIKARDAFVSEGFDDLAGEMSEVLEAFKSKELTAGQILGSKGGNTPPKPGSRPRGRPRKEVKE